MKEGTYYNTVSMQVSRPQTLLSPFPDFLLYPRCPSNEHFSSPQPPPQPTDRQMFGHLAVTEEQVKKSEQEWGGAINNWLAEATKPISSRFASEEEEAQYWSNLKVSEKAYSVE